ncbi:MAG TPA: hypothetical protein VN901_26840 [Candidatus Acidoferrales bacterium]|nr:hypothetical protein [Candidatus Acidoferrales bacterium]
MTECAFASILGQQKGSIHYAFADYILLHPPRWKINHKVKKIPPPETRVPIIYQ